MTTALKPISIQLYTLRDEAAKGMGAVLQRLAKIGYKAVEPAGFFDLSVTEFRKQVEDLGMVVSSSHSPWAKADNIAEIIDTCGLLGVDMIAGGYGADEFKSIDAITKTAEITAKMSDELAAAGITLTLHNHAWEFEKIDGRLKYEIFAELCPNVKFELDTYWSSNFGENDAVEMVKQFGSRAPLLHIKDGPLVRPPSVYNEEKNTLEVIPGGQASLLPVGHGKMNIPGVIAALDPAVTKWLVVEQDNSDTDMWECVEKSYRYLVDNKLGA